MLSRSSYSPQPLDLTTNGGFSVTKGATALDDKGNIIEYHLYMLVQECARTYYYRLPQEVMKNILTYIPNPSMPFSRGVAKQQLAIRVSHYALIIKGKKREHVFCNRIARTVPSKKTYTDPKCPTPTTRPPLQALGVRPSPCDPHHRGEGRLLRHLRGWLALGWCLGWAKTLVVFQCFFLGNMLKLVLKGACRSQNS